MGQGTWRHLLTFAPNFRPLRHVIIGVLQLDLAIPGAMSLKDKLEIGLKPDAPYRKDNLPEGQQDDSACEEAATPGESPTVERARDDCDDDQLRRVRKPVEEVTDRKR